MKEFLIETILEAGDTVGAYFGRAKLLYTKENEMAVVTEADVASDEIITTAIKEQYPTHGFVSEESGSYQEESEFVWHIDPVDGTRNFYTGVPIFGINIALAKENDIILAAIFLPATGELVIAEKDAGVLLATRDESKNVLCSNKQEWRGVFGLSTVSFNQAYADFRTELLSLSEGTAWVNAISSPAVCAVWMSCGRRDFYVSARKNSWDFAAPVLVGREAGCVVTNLSGRAWRPGDTGVVMANKYLHPELLKAAQNAYEIRIDPSIFDKSSTEVPAS